MHNIQIGSFVLNGQLLLYLWFGTAGWLMLRYYYRNKTVQEEVLSCISNGFWLWILVWKASFLLFHPMEVIQQPISLIYFDGGERGVWLAGLVTAVYMGMKAIKRSISFLVLVNSLILYMLAGYLASQLLLLLTGVELFWFHLTSAALSAVFLVPLLLSSRPSNIPATRGFVYAIWFCIGHIALWFYVPDRQTWLLSFNKQQVFFFLVAAGLAGMSWLNDKKQNGGFNEYD